MHTNTRNSKYHIRAERKLSAAPSIIKVGIAQFPALSKMAYLWDGARTWPAVTSIFFPGDLQRPDRRYSCRNSNTLRQTMASSKSMWFHSKAMLSSHLSGDIHTQNISTRAVGAHSIVKTSQTPRWSHRFWLHHVFMIRGQTILRGRDNSQAGASIHNIFISLLTNINYETPIGLERISL